MIAQFLCRGVHVTRLPDQTEEPARSDDSGGRWRVSTLQTRSRRVEWRVFSSKTAATRPARSPLQMQASSVQIRRRLAIFHLDRRRFCSDLLRSDDFGSDPAIFFKKTLRSVTCKLISVTLAQIRRCLSSDRRRFALLQPDPTTFRPPPLVAAVRQFQPNRPIVF